MSAGEEIEKQINKRKDAIERQSHMNNNPFPSQLSSVADAKNQGRSRVKIAVYSVVAVHVAGLVALLLTQGCRQQKPPEEQTAPSQSMVDTNPPAFVDNTNPPPHMTELTNPPVILDPVVPPPAAASTYEVKAGDSFTTIAAANHTSVTAITAANPGVDSRKLKIGQKLTLPAPGAATTPTAPKPVDPSLYTVKSGDTLGKIATVNHTTVSAIKSLNGLATDQIKVGQKLKLPVKAAPAPEVPPVMPDPTLAPSTVPVR